VVDYRGKTWKCPGTYSVRSSSVIRVGEEIGERKHEGCPSATELDSNRSSFKLAPCFHAGFFLSLFFNPEDGGDIFLRNVGLHGVISQKMVLFNHNLFAIFIHCGWH
jgi:hypothetical protein